MRAFPQKEKTMSANNFSTHRGRQSQLGKASAALADALCIRPVNGDPGYIPGELVEDLATVFRKRLAPCERLTVASAAMMSLDPDSRDAIIRTAERGRRADSVFRREGCHPVARHG